jgi:hypothetical protein
MIATLITLLAVLFTPSTDADALRRTAPSYLTPSSASDNLDAARIAGALVNVDPDLLLSIAWHESRYEPQAVGREPGGRVSCGPMTPEPVARCTAKPMLAGYVAGARHLRDWIGATPDIHTALLGYAGGFSMIRACARGPVLRPRGAHDDLCMTPEVFLWRRDWIRRERTRPPAV